MELVIPLTIDDKTAAQLRQAGVNLDQFKGRVGGATKATDAMARSTSRTADTVKRLATAWLGFRAARGAADALGGFDEQMKTLQGVTSATADEMAKFEARARSLGGTTRFAASQAAEGMVLLSRAGLEANQTIGAIGSTLDLATAASITLGQSSDIAANTMKQFGLDASEATRVADNLVETSNRTNTNVLQLGEAMKFAGVNASQMGINLEQTSAALGVLADRGLRATVGGTALRAVILGLTSVTPIGEKALESMGLTIDDVRIKNGDLTASLKALRDANLGVTESTALFGRRFAAAGLILSSQADQVDNLSERLDGAGGAASRFARIMETSMIGRMKAFTSSLQEATLSVGEAGLTGAINGTLIVMTDAVRVLTGMERDMDTASQSGEILARVIKTIGVALGATALVKAGQMFFNMAVGIKAAAAAMVTFDKVATLSVIGRLLQIGVVLGTVIVGVHTMTSTLDTATVAMERFATGGATLSARVKDFAASQRLLSAATFATDRKLETEAIREQIQIMDSLKKSILRGNIEFKPFGDLTKATDQLRSLKGFIDTFELSGFIPGETVAKLKEFEGALASINLTQIEAAKAAQAGFPDAYATDLAKARGHAMRVAEELSALSGSGKLADVVVEALTKRISMFQQNIADAGPKLTELDKILARLADAKPPDLTGGSVDKFERITTSLRAQAEAARFAGLKQQELAAITQARSSAGRDLTRAEANEIQNLVRLIEQRNAAQAVRGMQDSLQEELLLVRLNRNEQEQLNRVLEFRNTILQANVGLSGEAVASIVQSVEQIQQIAERNQLGEQLGASLGQTAASGLSQAIINSQEADQAFAQLGLRLADQMLTTLIGSLIQPLFDVIGSVVGGLATAISTASTAASPLTAQSKAIAAALNAAATSSGLLTTGMAGAGGAAAAVSKQLIASEALLGSMIGSTGILFTAMSTGITTMAATGLTTATAQLVALKPIVASLTAGAVASAIASYGSTLTFGGIATGMIEAARASALALAEGGIVMPTQGGVLAKVAEAGEPEVVVPLSKASAFFEKNAAKLGLQSQMQPNNATRMALDSVASQFASTFSTVRPQPPGLAGPITTLPEPRSSQQITFNGLPTAAPVSQTSNQGSIEASDGPIILEIGAIYASSAEEIVDSIMDLMNQRLAEQDMAPRRSVI